jgi:hypothetical protein
MERREPGAVIPPRAPRWQSGCQGRSGASAGASWSSTDAPCLVGTLANSAWDHPAPCTAVQLPHLAQWPGAVMRTTVCLSKEATVELMSLKRTGPLPGPPGPGAGQRPLWAVTADPARSPPSGCFPSAVLLQGVRASELLHLPDEPAGAGWIAGRGYSGGGRAFFLSAGRARRKLVAMLRRGPL